MKLLTRCTLTGADQSTSNIELASLSHEFPIAEWGFLYSPSRQGTIQNPKYPGIAFIERAFKVLPAHVDVALHICGKGVPDLIHGGKDVTDLVNQVNERGGRVQLNFNARRGEVSVVQLAATMNTFPFVQFITQQNDANATVWRILQTYVQHNHAVLFDTSGGRGESPDGWPNALSGISCGYAGGLGPDNIAEELPKIAMAANSGHFWIDMEGKVRDEDGFFDLNKAKQCLEAASAFIKYTS
jgi:phosphoribosylanthranilate isomerase